MSDGDIGLLYVGDRSSDDHRNQGPVDVARGNHLHVLDVDAWIPCAGNDDGVVGAGDRPFGEVECTTEIRRRNVARGEGPKRVDPLEVDVVPSGSSTRGNCSPGSFEEDVVDRTSLAAAHSPSVSAPTMKKAADIRMLCCRTGSTHLKIRAGACGRSAGVGEPRTRIISLEVAASRFRQWRRDLRRRAVSRQYVDVSLPNVSVEYRCVRLVSAVPGTL